MTPCRSWLLLLPLAAGEPPLQVTLEREDARGVVQTVCAGCTLYSAGDAPPEAHSAVKLSALSNMASTKAAACAMCNCTALAWEPEYSECVQPCPTPSARSAACAT